MQVYISRPPDTRTCFTRLSLCPCTQLFTRADHQTHVRVTPLKLCPSCTQLFTQADRQTHVLRSVHLVCVHAHNSLHEQTARHTYLGQFTQPVSRYTTRYTSRPPGRLFLLLKPHRVHSKVHFNIARTSPELPARMNRARHNL